MPIYTKLVDYGAKDLLLTGDPAKAVKGTEVGAEFDSIAAADATNVKTDGGNQTIAGTKTFSSTISGSITGNAATVTIADAAADTTTWPLLGTSQTGNLGPATDAGLTYNASTNVLTTTGGVTTVTLTATGLTDISGASAGQIKFPAAQNASADVNTLDDYEEGTWTPVLTFATPGNLSVTYTTQTGTYTKIGNRIFADVFINTATFTHTTASGQLQVTGLPFNAGSVKYNNLNYSGITKAGYSVVTAITNSGTTTLTIEACGSGVAAATVTTADCPTGGNMVLRGPVIYTL